MASAAMNTIRQSRSALDKGLLLRPPNLRLSGSRLEELQASRCLPEHLRTNSHDITSRRSFTSVVPREFPRPSRSLRSPRWINTRQTGRTTRTDKSDAENGTLSGGSTHSSNFQSHDLDSDVRLNENDDNRGSSSSSASSSSTSSSGGSDDNNSSSSSSPPPRESLPVTSAISKQSVPEHYPQVLALPIARRPLFPGFYKAVVIRNAAVVAAIKEMMKRGQPYLGAFLLKDEQADSDVISDINSVHHVGVFAQITSVFSATGGAAKDGEETKEEGLTAVLYPHRRIKLTGFVNKGDGSSAVGLQDIDETSEGPITPPPSPVPLSSNPDLSHSENDTSQQRSNPPHPRECISSSVCHYADHMLHSPITNVISP
jgi:ATP-dependent Lon protease